MAVDDDIDRWSDAAPMLVGSGWADSTFEEQYIFAGRLGSPDSRGESHRMFVCIFVSALDHGGLTRLGEVKKANKTNATIPQRPDNNDNGID